MDEGRFSELELLFIAETLDQHGEYLSDLFTESIEEKNLISDEDTQHLIDSISFKTQYGNNPKLQFNFPDHGRFIEIRYHKKSTNTELWSQESINKALWGRHTAAKVKAKRKKKDTRWYARNLYGSMNRLIGILLYELTDEERKRLTQILERQKLS